MEIQIGTGKFFPIIQDLNKFNESLDNIHKNCKEKKTKSPEYGYLIEQTILDTLKIKIHYEQLKKCEKQADCLTEIHKIFKDSEGITIQGCEPKIFNNYHELEEDLQKDIGYNIINISIWKNMNNENLDIEKGKIKYEIDSENLTIFINNKEKAVFKYNSNIINKKNLVEQNEKENFGNTGNIYEDSYSPRIIKKSKTKLGNIRNENNNDDSNCIKKSIITLLELFYFFKEIKNKIKFPSSIYEGKCYLIKKNWILNYNNFEFYNIIYQSLINNNKKREKEEIIEDLYKKYKLNDKENKIKEVQSIDNDSQFTIELKKNYDKSELLFLEQYILINESVLRNIVKENFDYKSIKALNFCINSGKIIIQYEEKNCLFIGTLGNEIYLFFIPEIILKYANKDLMETNFSDFQNNKLPSFDKNFNKGKKIDIIFKTGHKSEKIGKIYKIDKNKYYQIDKFIENIISSLFNSFNDINKEMKQNFFINGSEKKLYIINGRYINKLIELFKYKDFLVFKENYEKSNNSHKNDINKII